MAKACRGYGGRECWELAISEAILGLAMFAAAHRYHPQMVDWVAG